MPNSADIEVKAGAIMDDDIGDTSVKQDTINVAAHLRLIDPTFGIRILSLRVSGLALTVLRVLWIIVRVPCHKIRVLY
jgi:hypothetical protein